VSVEASSRRPVAKKVRTELAESSDLFFLRQTLNQKTDHNAIFTHEIERDAPTKQAMTAFPDAD
jgi:hypothetical protein